MLFEAYENKEQKINDNKFFLPLLTFTDILIWEAFQGILRLMQYLGWTGSHSCERSLIFMILSFSLPVLDEVNEDK